METNQKNDVLIVGGGLAGLTLALQLKGAQPDISVVVLEQRNHDAPAATHKVGESISEIASNYLREKLNLRAYLEEHHLPKFGLRFFFSPQFTTDISRRVEIGTRISHFNPTHQLDRGILENELATIASFRGIEVVFGAKVKEWIATEIAHQVSFVKDGTECTTSARWMIDATGRSSFLKRKLGLEKEMEHEINAAWFRIHAEIDISQWSEDLTWGTKVPAGGRRLATNHLMGEGYWVWIIPLVSGATSIGIVADPRFHPFEYFNTFEKAMKWMQKHEPQAASILSQQLENKMDFKVMKNFAYDSKQFFSSDRWAVTGEAAAFADPLYSPGSDFIAFTNTWITDLIVRDLRCEEISMRIKIYELVMKELLAGWILLYENMYGIFCKGQIMIMKIVWDWASYWSVPCVLFMNEGYTNLSVLKKYSTSSAGIGRRFAQLNKKMQTLFATWSKNADQEYGDFYGNLFEMAFLRQLHGELTEKHKESDLMKKIEANLSLLEQVAAEIFRKVSYEINGTPPDMKVNPYEMSLDDDKDLLLTQAKDQNALEINEQIRSDLYKMWLLSAKTQTHEQPA